jgi:hypothetical protein
MMLNVTFVIQIINFWITYVVLHKFLFKPMVALLIQKERAKLQLVEGLKDKEHVLFGLQEDKGRVLEKFKLHVKQQYTINPLSEEEAPLVSVCQIRAEELTTLVCLTSEFLINRIESAV